MATSEWKKKRGQQGLSYAEVVAELKRRAGGNYLFSKKENSERLRRAIAAAGKLFRLSAHMHDFFEAEGLDPALPLNIFGDRAVDDAINITLDPFPFGNDTHDIATDGLIDLLYPGPDFEVERGITLVYIKKKAEE